MPLPTGLPWELNFTFWILIAFVGMLVSILAFFIKGFIGKVEAFAALGNEIKNEAISMKKSNVDFQAVIQTELSNIKDQAREIEGTLLRTNEKVDDLERKLDSMNEKVDENISRSEKDMQLVFKKVGIRVVKRKARSVEKNP